MAPPGGNNFPYCLGECLDINGCRDIIRVMHPTDYRLSEPHTGPSTILAQSAGSLVHSIRAFERGNGARRPLREP